MGSLARKIKRAQERRDGTVQRRSQEPQQSQPEYPTRAGISPAALDHLKRKAQRTQEQIRRLLAESKERKEPHDQLIGPAPCPDEGNVPDEIVSAVGKKKAGLVTPLDYVIRRRHWAAACHYGLGPTFEWIDRTADQLEAAGYRTAKQRAAAAVNGSVSDEPVLDLEIELQRRIDMYLEDLTRTFHAKQEG